MRRIAIASFKGGTGKSTIAVNLAIGMARAGKRVLFLDLDPQGGASTYLGLKLDGRPHTADVLTGSAEINEAEYEVAGENALFFIRADLALTGAERNLEDGDEFILREALSAADGLYDVVLMDTPPAWGMLTVNALSAANECMAVVETRALSMKAFASLIEMIQAVRVDLNPELRLSGVIPSRVMRTKMSKRALRDLEHHVGGLLLPGIRESARVSEAPLFHQALADYAPGDIGDQDFAALLKKFI